MSNRIRTFLSGAWPAVPGIAGLLAGLLVGPGAALAGESRIELRDGSVLRGELVSVEAGAYRIRTANLGEIEVRESDLLAIRPLGEGETPAASALSAPAPSASGVLGGDDGGQIGALQRQMATDPGLMQAILALQSDPELQSALADPEFTRRILAGDLAALQSDPRFLRLLAHPGIRDIVGRVAAP